MGFDNVLTTTTYQSDDQSWLGSAEGTQSMISGTAKLDDARFVEATHFPDGFLPSGIVVAQITASKLWVPYADAGGDDGGRTAVGFLFTPKVVRAGATRVEISILWRGRIREAKLPAGHGLDAAAKVDLAAKFRFD
jgi:hypothetical protein